jgi:hypothetical protein
MDEISLRCGADKDREVYWRGAAQAIAMTAEVTVLLGKTVAGFSCSRSEQLSGWGRFDLVSIRRAALG